MALVRTMELLEEQLGSDIAKWSWGRLHSVAFNHPAGGTPFLGTLLNRGPFPAEGSLTTINVAGYKPGTNDFNVGVYR